MPGKQNRDSRWDIYKILLELKKLATASGEASTLLPELLDAVQNIELDVDSIDLSNAQLVVNTDDLEALTQELIDKPRPIQEASCFTSSSAGLVSIQWSAAFDTTVQGPTITDIQYNGATLALPNYPYDPTIAGDRTQFATDMTALGFSNSSIVFDAGTTYNVFVGNSYADTPFEDVSGAGGTIVFSVASSVFTPRVDYMMQFLDDGSCIMIDVQAKATIGSIPGSAIGVSCDAGINSIGNYLLNSQSADLDTIISHLLVIISELQDPTNLAQQSTLDSIRATLELVLTELGNIEAELKKYGKHAPSLLASGFEQVTVDNTVAGIPITAPAGAKGCVIYVEGADVRFRFGTAPTATIGVLVEAGDYIELGELSGKAASELSDILFIRTTAVNATLNVQYYNAAP